jgi:hypothetical protein
MLSSAVASVSLWASEELTHGGRHQVGLLQMRGVVTIIDHQVSGAAERDEGG